MAESKISQITLVKSKEEYSSDENIEINVNFQLKEVSEMHSMKQIGLKHTITMMFQ